jgi:hypothetical protein
LRSTKKWGNRFGYRFGRDRDTSWDTASCIVELENDSDAGIHIELRDPYVGDRIVQSTVTRAELGQAKQIFYRVFGAKKGNTHVDELTKLANLLE